MNKHNTNPTNDATQLKDSQMKYHDDLSRQPHLMENSFVGHRDPERGTNRGSHSTTGKGYKKSGKK